MKKIQKILNLLLLFAILIGDVFYILENTLLIKSITSAMFVILGAINLFFAIKSKTPNKKFCITMIVGLFFAMLGDILLEIEFIVGALLFAVGHIFYFIAYCFLKKFNLRDLIPGTCIFIPSLLIITLVPLFDFGGILMQIVCIFYALIISLMVGKSISNLLNKKSPLNILIVVGSILFFFSDFMLLFNVFANVSRIFGILCLATYYPAEFVLAFSISQSEK